MTSSPWFRRFAFAYGPAFAVLYVIALVRDLALFTVYPSLGIVLLGTHHSADIVSPSIAFANPAMYWYGWTATAALGSARSRRCCRFFARAMDATVLIGVVMGGSRRCDGCVRLPHDAVAPTC